MTTSSNVPRLRRALGAWYGEHGRHDLEWRLTRDPYAVLVSEVMLQQTQVERVRPYYREWLGRWPTADALASADTADVIRAWAGLGYNRRAVNLQRAARQAVAAHGGVPSDHQLLHALPGVGPYTASAVACFAGDARLIVLDTNVMRVVARVSLGVSNARERPVADVRAAAGELLPRSGARDHNLALMDLGAIVCTARAPACEACPIRSSCAWRAAGRPNGAVASRRSPAFETTARFARGRIIAALRAADGALAEGEIAGRLPAAHAARTAVYLAALARDGLVAQVPGGWSLPVTAG